MNLKEWWANIKDWMVWAETYLIWGLVLGSGVIGMVFTCEASVDYRSFNKIIHGEEMSEPGESVVELFNLKITGLSSGQDDTYYRYITVVGISKSMPLYDRIPELEKSEGVTAIAGLESFPSFLIKDEHSSFWKTHFTLMLMFKYGGWIAMSLFVIVFGYLNMKQDNKLLTTDIEYLIFGTFILVLIGDFVYDHLNIRMINFLTEEFQFSASAGALSSYTMNFVLFALLLAYIIIAKATPVQKEQDLTV